ncbi:MAG: hypothetical protein KFF72_15790 [Arthrospira sp. SH-MAG29]|nr:hypothetical protein [Arthrospira sp. SH-MAG29]MBS0017782.1 hypothetical protein [Arthrospira sp. SH-MAG29]
MGVRYRGVSNIRSGYQPEIIPRTALAQGQGCFIFVFLSVQVELNYNLEIPYKLGFSHQQLNILRSPLEA